MEASFLVQITYTMYFKLTNFYFIHKMTTTFSLFTLETVKATLHFSLEIGNPIAAVM